MRTAPMVAALFVQPGGVYFDLPGVDPWDASRDARKYPGPYSVICHPPCARWGRYWSGGPSAREKGQLGSDDGCFESALAAVRRFGGVLEHPEASHAWRSFELNLPPRNGGWVAADFDGGWTCCVEQGYYGHPARKATWLYARGFLPPPLKWGRAPGDFLKMDDGFHSAADRARAVKRGICERLSKRQRAATPVQFRDLLIDLARMARGHAMA